MLLLHETREENMDAMLDSSSFVTSALYSVSSQSGKSKNKRNKNRNTNRGTSKGEVILVCQLVQTILQVLKLENKLNLHVSWGQIL